ncbi:MAG: hypothetical protein K2F53_01105, partial [Rikenellaceae bacterium]|nr:hypothetical protein [Rikenellaceae bacterium]
MFGSIFTIFSIISVIGIVLYVTLIVGVCNLASRYGRSVLLWLLVSIFFTPVLPIIYLLFSGETDSHRRKRIIEEEVWRRSLDYFNPNPNQTYQDRIG